MSKGELKKLCDRTVLTVHCKNGDHRISVACLMLLGMLVLFHVAVCKYHCMREAMLKKRICKAEEKCASMDDPKC